MEVSDRSSVVRDLWTMATGYLTKADPEQVSHLQPGEPLPNLRGTARPSAPPTVSPQRPKQHNTVPEAIDGFAKMYSDRMAGQYATANASQALALPPMS